MPHKKKPKRRLTNIDATKIAIVDMGANDEPDFFIVKRKFDYETLTEEDTMSDKQIQVDGDAVVLSKKDMETLVENAIAKGVAAGVKAVDRAKNPPLVKNQAIGALVSQKRGEMGKSVEELAAQVGISPGDLQSIEAGENVALTNPVMEALASALGIDMTQLKALAAEDNEGDVDVENQQDGEGGAASEVAQATAAVVDQAIQDVAAADTPAEAVAAAGAAVADMLAAAAEVAEGDLTPEPKEEEPAAQE